MTTPDGADPQGEADSKARLEERARAFVGSVEELGHSLVGRQITSIGVSIGGETVTFTLDDGSCLQIRGTSNPALSPRTLRMDHGASSVNTALDTRQYLPAFQEP